MSDRKKPKKYSKMDYMQKQTYVKDQLKELGQEAVYHQDSGGRGSSSTGMFDLQESEAALRKAASNDYDRRESLKYGVNSGDKRFKGLDASSGFDSMTALVNTDRAISKYGHNELGHKNMSSDADFAAVSNSLFNKSRSNLTDSMSANEQQEQAEAGSDAPVELSTELKDAKEKVQAYDNRKSDRFARKPEAGDADTQRKTATNSFLEKYKLDIKGEMSPVLPS